MLPVASPASNEVTVAATASTSKSAVPVTLTVLAALAAARFSKLAAPFESIFKVSIPFAVTSI